ncbi:MAG: hypothetical protein ABIQ47_16930 [Tepidiformaceae bacterium]
MNEEPRSCPDCSASYFVTDNYCRQCGMYVAALREMPLVKTEAAVPARTERERAALPAPVRKAATALAIGTALQIGVGLAGRYVASQAARQATRAAVNGAAASRRKPARNEAPSRAVTTDPNQDAVAISETVMIRRVWIRRS